MILAIQQHEWVSINFELHVRGAILVVQFQRGVYVKVAIFSVQRAHSTLIDCQKGVGCLMRIRNNARTVMIPTSCMYVRSSSARRIGPIILNN